MLQQPSWLSICPQLELVTGVKVIIGLYIVAIKENVTYDRTAPQGRSAAQDGIRLAGRQS